MLFGGGAVIKVVAILIIVLVFAGGFYYISGLRADLAVSEINNQRLQEGIEAQQALMEQMRADIAQIQTINQDLKQENDRQQAEVKALSNRFSQNARGEVRDFGALAAERPDAIQRAVNRGTANALRCLELASGAPHTEQELNATTLSEINRECPTLANPRYQPAPGR
jgi:type II secretory pathway pseudopilin PulG